MSLFLPPEILDLIVDHLHDEPTTLRECCLVSKSWIPRTRAHIFDHVELSLTRPALKRWTQTFPDPSNSPARYTRSLHLSNLRTITVEIPDVLPQIRSFDHIVELTVVTDVGDFFTQLRGLSPNLKYLHISHGVAPLSDVLDFICSFPLLEDLVLHYLTTNGNTDGWDALPTSPKFTGSFRWSCSDRDIVHKLLGLPGGLHLSKIVAFCSVRDSGVLYELVSKCSDTLESLGVELYQGAFFISSVTTQCLIAPHSCKQICVAAFAQPLRGQKAQGCGISIARTASQVDRHNAPNCYIRKPSADHHPPCSKFLFRRSPRPN